MAISEASSTKLRAFESILVDNSRKTEWEMGVVTLFIKHTEGSSLSLKNAKIGSPPTPAQPSLKQEPLLTESMCIFQKNVGGQFCITSEVEGSVLLHAASEVEGRGRLHAASGVEGSG